MRRLLVATLTAGCLLVEGAAASQAAPVPTGAVQHVTSASTSAAPAQATSAGSTSSSTGTSTSGSRTVALDAPAVQEAAAHPERRRVRTKKRSGIGRFFGALAFLFIGLPMLIVLGLVLFFMLRRSRKQQESQMIQHSGPGQWNDPAQQYRSGQNGPDRL